MTPRRQALVLLLASTALAALPAACSASDGNAIQDESELREDGGRDADADARGDAATSVTPNVFVDPRDNQSYPTIQIGAKTWFAKNLAFAIPGSSFCYGDDPRNCTKDGRLYPFNVAKTACPTGWHLGSDDDWKALEVATGMASNQLALEGYSTVRGTNEGTKLKAATGFGAHMAGYRSGTDYDALGDRTYFWTATMRGADVWRRRISAADPTVFRFTNPPQGFAISIRCVKD